jgi:small-conductance mechanosensitive channel
MAAVQDTLELKPYHYVSFFVAVCFGLLFVSVMLYLTGDIEFQRAVVKSVSRLLRTVAIRQVGTILSAILFIKYALEPVIKTVRRMTKAEGEWEKSSEYFVLREVYKPLEGLFMIAALTTLAENMIPQMINIPKSIVQTLVRSTNCLVFVIAAANVVFNIKGRIVREQSWQFELKGDLTRQRRLEAIDKLMSLGTLVISSFFGVRALGMDVNSVLAIGGVGGVALGLAGREILENLFTGLIILTSNPFEVGDEVQFKPASGQVVEGIVLDVGWYRTTIRSFEREIFTIPNSVFTRNVVLNITRKNREWRFYEFLYLRLEDLPRVTDIVSDARKILRQDNRIIQKLHRRVFLDDVTKEHCRLYLSFYVEAANRDAFMAIKQDLLLAFIDVIERNGATLARNRLQLEMLQQQSMMEGPDFVELPALPQVVDITNETVVSVGGGGGGAGVSVTGSVDDVTIINTGAPTGTLKRKKAASSADSTTAKSPSSKAATAATNTAAASAASTTAAQPSPASIAKAMSNSENAAKAISKSVSPEMSAGGVQEGPIVLGSILDDSCD